MGVLLFLGCFVLLSLLSNNPSLFLVLIPVAVIAILAKLRANKIDLQESLEREKLLQAQAAERAEQQRLDAIESKKMWDIEANKQKRARMQRVNKKRENFGIVSEVCGVCGSGLNPNGLCVSGCKPLEE